MVDRSSPEPAGVAPAVALTDVSVRFPRRSQPVLNGVFLDLQPGEQVLVLGPSGSGKSTLLDTVAGFVPHSVNAALSGEVRVCGSVTAHSSVVELARHVAVMRQDPASGICLPLVEQELSLPLENRSTEPGAISDKIEAALRSTDCLHLRSRRTNELSGGEAQRIALAAALVADPHVLLLDEPTSMLDARGIRSVNRALRSTTSERRPTVLTVEHRLDDLAGHRGVPALPPRAVVLDAAGSVRADGRTTEVLREQASMLVESGCWLPLEAELHALSGCQGGLASRQNQRLLLGLAGRSPSGERDRCRGRSVLTAQDVAASRQEIVTRRRSGRRRAAAVPMLTGINITLHAGETVALLGANGSGKSTLLLTMAGLIAPADGRVEGRQPGLVFQNAEHQFFSHTVVDEVGYQVREQRQRVVARQLQRHRLEHLATQNPFSLSGGEQRRLGLAAMLAHEREALLLDEPTLGLDRRDTLATLRLLREIAAEGSAVMFASHDLRSVATIADRAVVLAGGAVIADGPMWQVLADEPTIRRAGLSLPPVLRWLLGNTSSAMEAHSVLEGLDGALGTRPTADCGTRP